MQRCAFQYLLHLSAQPPLTIAQDRSPDLGDTHHAAVRLPPAPPTDRHVKVGPDTRICPSLDRPFAVPTSSTSASRAAFALAFGQGWPGEQLPSISLAAMPESLTRGPSAHHIGPSPSQTRVGVHSNDCPALTIVEPNNSNSIKPMFLSKRSELHE